MTVYKTSFYVQIRALEKCTRRWIKISVTIVEVHIYVKEGQHEDLLIEEIRKISDHYKAKSMITDHHLVIRRNVQYES